MTDITYAYGTTTALRAGAWHAGVLVNFPGLAEQLAVGQINDAGVEIELHPDIDDGVRWLAAEGALDGVSVTVEAVLTITDDAGNVTEQAHTRTLTAAGATLDGGRVRVTLVDLDVARLNATWPTLTWDTAGFPDIRAEDAGRTIAHPVGTVRKLPGLLLQSVAGDWRYGIATGEAVATIIAADFGASTYTVSGDWTGRIAVGQVVTAVSTLSDLRHVVSAVALSTGNTVVTVTPGVNVAASSLSLLPAVLAVYRNGRLVDSGEYAVHHVVVAAGPAIGVRYVEVRFTAEQRDFSGNLFEIAADVRGVVGRNAVSHIALMLQRAGATIDTASFADAEAFAEAEHMWLDADLGRDGPRRIRATIEDMAFIARAALRRTDAGAYAIVQDRPATLGASLDESAGDLITATNYRRERRPASIGLRYRPSPQDPDRLQHEIRRAVSASGVGDDAARDVPYLSDHEAADRLLCYLARRAEFNAALDLRDHAGVRQLGERIALRSPVVYPGNREWMVWEMTTAAPGAALALREYDDAVYTYVPGTLPPDAVIGFEPDYSRTPPNAPTALSQSAAATSTGADGQTVARLTASAVPPTVNAAETWFAAVHTATGAITLGQGSAAGGGVYSAVLGDLRPGEAYQVLAWAVNAWGLKGAAASINVTAAGTAGAPAAPTDMQTSNAGAVVNQAGDGVAYITVSVIPPSANAASVWFAAVRNTTGETVTQQAGAPSAGRVATTFTGLRPGEAYTLQAYALNANGLRGPSASTGITAAGVTVDPPAPSGYPGQFSAVAVGTTVFFSWSVVANGLVDEYSIERERRSFVNGVPGSVEQARAEIWRSRANQFGESGLLVDKQYSYWITAHNRWGRTAIGTLPARFTTSTGGGA